MADSVSVEFGASTRNFEQGINNLQRPVADFSDRIRELNNQLSALDNPIKRVSNTANIAADSTKKLSFATAGATREFIVIGHEVLTGNFSRIPGSLLVLAERAGNLHSIMSYLTPATLGWGAAIGAAAYATYEWVSASNELEETQNAVAGELDASGRSLSYNADQVARNILYMREYESVTSEEAQKIVVAFAAIPEATLDTQNKLVRFVDTWKHLTHAPDNVAAAQNMAKVFTDPAKAVDELAAKFPKIISANEAWDIKQKEASEGARAASEELLNVIGPRLQEYREKYVEPLVGKWEKLARDAAIIGNPTESFNLVPRQAAPMPQSQAAKEQEEHLKNNRLMADGLKIADKVKSAQTEINKLIEQRKTEVDAVNAAMAEGKDDVAARLQQGVDDIDRKKAELQKRLRAQNLAEERKATEERLSIERNATDTQVQLGKIALQSKRADLDEEVALGRITNKEKIALLREYEQEEFNLSRAALVKESQQDGLSLLQKQQIYSRLRILYAQHQAQMGRLEAQGAREQARVYDQVFQSMNQAFKGSIDGILRGTQTWQQATANIFTNVLSSWAGMLEEMAAKWLETQLLNAVVGKTEAGTTIAAHASEAGAAAYASTAAIPIVGPELAPAAAQLAYGSTLAYAGGLEVGAWEVPGTMLATLHEGETVVPKNFAQGLRENGSLAGGGDIHFHVNAVDAKSVDRLFKNNGAAIAASLKKQVRNLNADINSLRPS